MILALPSFSTVVPFLAALLLVHFASATSPDTAARDPASATASFRTLQYQIIHRHGDRTPITPLKDEEFWQRQLPDPTTFQRLSRRTRVLQAHDTPAHVAAGRGPFGQLTQMGIQQMMQLGRKLQKDLRIESPEDIEVLSTGFPRTIQSVQALIEGLFPNIDQAIVTINATGTTSWMIPDPQPRRTRKQAQLEYELSQRAHILAKEEQMLPLAHHITRALHPFLSKDAHEFAFGVCETNDDGESATTSSSSIEIEPLAWNQLAEVTKCMHVYGKLPIEITQQDQQSVSEYTAWKWFQNLRNPELSKLSMGTLVKEQLERCLQAVPTKLVVWSAHDSTLIGLVCAYRLSQPSQWPEYSSALQLELLERVNGECTPQRNCLFLRFSLNGEVLESEFATDHDKTMVPLQVLIDEFGKIGSS